NVPPEIGLAVQAVHECIAPKDALAIVETVIDLELEAILRLRNGSLHDEVILLREGQSRAVRRRIISLRFERHWIQPIGRDDIAGERIAYEPSSLRRVCAGRAGVIDHFHLARSDQALRKIAAPLEF